MKSESSIDNHTRDPHSQSGQNNPNRGGGRIDTVDEQSRGGGDNESARPLVGTNDDGPKVPSRSSPAAGFQFSKDIF